MSPHIGDDWSSIFSYLWGIGSSQLTTILGRCLCSPAPYIADGLIEHVLNISPSMAKKNKIPNYYW